MILSGPLLWSGFVLGELSHIKSKRVLTDKRLSHRTLTQRSTVHIFASSINIRVRNCFYFLLWHSFKNIISGEQEKGNSNLKKHKNHRNKTTLYLITQKTRYLNSSDCVMSDLSSGIQRILTYASTVTNATLRSYLWFPRPARETRAAIQFSLQSREWQWVPIFKTNLEGERNVFFLWVGQVIIEIWGLFVVMSN